MFIFRILTVLLVLVFNGCTPTNPVESKNELLQSNPQTIDRVSIDGTWEVTNCIRDGVEFPSEIGGTIVFESNNATVKTTDGVSTAYRIELKSDQKPNEIDWFLTTADNQTSVLRGLYEFSGDKLMTCSPSEFNSQRPAKLESTPSDGQWLFTLERKR